MRFAKSAVLSLAVAFGVGGLASASDCYAAAAQVKQVVVVNHDHDNVVFIDNNFNGFADVAFINGRFVRVNRFQNVVVVNRGGFVSNVLRAFGL